MIQKHRHPRMAAEQGVTLVEVLAALSMFSVVSLAIVSFMSEVMGTVALEGRAVEASAEMSNAIRMLQSELRMSSVASPYLVGDDPSVVTCGGALSVTATTVRFLVAEDDAASPSSALVPYYVGYSYDAGSSRLLRGQIAAPSISSCALPSGNPASAPTAEAIARNVVRIDADGDGSLDPVFSLEGDVLRVNLGARASSPGGRSVTQRQSTQIYVRVR